MRVVPFWKCKDEHCPLSYHLLAMLVLPNSTPYINLISSSKILNLHSTSTYQCKDRGAATYCTVPHHQQSFYQ